MAKKALCVGINDYPFDDSDLNGCINDANDWAELLIKRFDFPNIDVKVMLDEEATRQNILKGIQELLAGAKSGDVLVFANSSHGTYIADKSGDEYKYDEALCPYDTDDGNLLVDDSLRELFKDIPRGVRLTAIFDSCHSGSATRVFMNTADQRRRRFLNPSIWGGRELSKPHRASPRKLTLYPENKMNELLLSGCKDNQYSNDALIDGAFHGAMTYYALQAIRKARYKITYAQLAERIQPILQREGYDQDPQLEGKDENKERQIFT